jgi:pyridoxine 4-dehydrogenase
MGEPPDRAEAIRVLRRAVEMGVNFIDIANPYRPGVSEEIIAEALHPHPAGLVIATKGGYARPGPNQLGALRHLRAHGKIKNIGLSQMSVKQIQYARTIVPIVMVQNRYSLFDRGSEDALEYWEKGKMSFYSVVPASGRSSFRF